MASAPEGDDPSAAPPSRSARKRAAEEAQHLGEELIRLRDAELTALGLPEELTEAIRAARRITSRAAGARQRQYIGRLMRGIDLAAVRRLLAARAEATALEARRFQRLESWRERLLAGGPGALEELARAYPHLERPEWSRLIEAARHERASTGQAGGAARALFRALRTLLDAPE